MKSIFRALSLLVVLSLLFACTETTTTNNEPGNDNNGRVIGSISGVVSDANDNARLAGVTVTYAVRGVVYSTQTNDLGYYAIYNLPSGNYEITFSGNNSYAVSRTNIVIPNLEDIGISDFPTEDDFEYSVTRDKGLYTLDSTVNGTIMAYVNNEEIHDLSGIRITADLGIFDLAPSLYSTYTDSTGAFSFASLPSVSEFSLRIDSWTDGVHTFRAQEFDVYPVVQGVLNLNPVLLDVIDEVVHVIASNLDNFAIDNTIELTFDQAIDPETFEVALVNQTNGYVDINLINWISSTHVQIDPDEPLLLDHIYDLYVDCRTVNGNAFNWVTEFTTQPGIMIEDTNMELYDGYYRITPNQSIVINFSEQVMIGYVDNVLDISDYPAPVMSWSNNNKTLTIQPPAGGYNVGNIFIDLEFYSVLAIYDSVAKFYTVGVAD